MSVAHIIGLGRSGVAAARLLKREGWQVSVSDVGQSEALVDQQRSLAADGIPVELGSRFSLETLAQQTSDRPDRIVVSPGVSWQLPALVAAREQGIEVIGELELAWRYLQHCPWIGITGTNGKTTTTALVAAIFKAAGLKAPACGNIGYSACEVALADHPIDWVIAEVSSYQAESSPTLAPEIGVWTTFTPDHLERHGTLENYRDIKAHLLSLSTHKILNADDAYLSQNLTDRWPDALWTSTQGPLWQHKAAALRAHVYLENGWVMVGGDAVQGDRPQQIVRIDALRMPGEHNQQNLLQAIAVAHLAGIDATAIAEAVAAFPGVPHRLEYIRTWQGVDFINDSKATNYDAAQTGLAAVKAPAILIAGGSPKVGDDISWIETIQAQAAAVLLIGDAAPAFAQRLEQSGYRDYEIVGTMEQAVPRAGELAQQRQAKVVLLSPACASFDQYQNFEQRGEHFRKLCETALVT
jgi:UDP-N-acetylmuramoylalanine--D-glutamate ligase